MSAKKTTDKLQATFSVTALISVYQPVPEKILLEKLKPIISQRLLKEVLTQLTEDNRIILESGYYRTTTKGEKLILPGKPRRMRDIFRMFYLIERSAKGRCFQ